MLVASGDFSAFLPKLWQHFNDVVSYLLIAVLLGTGVLLSFQSRFAQIRLLPAMLRELRNSRSGARGGISSFQAFAIGLASRIGTGNIAGVAVAITVGGPGAILWMWLTATLGMATALSEASLAQLFKISRHDGTWQGGPAYYMRWGLDARKLGVVFSLLFLVCFGLAFNAVQANTITSTMQAAYALDERLCALLLVLLCAPIVFGGLRRIAKVAEWLTPVMALGYLAIAAFVILMNYEKIPAVCKIIWESAFGLTPAAGGILAGIWVALLNGVKRGLFSNEAGMGSAPNTAATATTSHPVKQGLVQSFGVAVDTLLVCSATAFIILLGGVWGSPGAPNGAALTQASVANVLGSGGIHFMSVAIFLFAFSSIIGNYAYAEGNFEYLDRRKAELKIFRAVVLVIVFVGGTTNLQTVWNVADLFMSLMALLNLYAILRLNKYARALLANYEKQVAAKVEVEFVPRKDAVFPATPHHTVWEHYHHDSQQKVDKSRGN